jgi:hypothetical protein
MSEKNSSSLRSMCSGCGAEFTSSHSVYCIPCMFVRSATRNEKPSDGGDTRRLKEESRKEPKTYLKPNSGDRDGLTRRHRKLTFKKKAQVQAKASDLPISKGVVCPLCDRRIPPGEMLDHKASSHGEAKVVPSPAQPHKKDQWVSVYQGGLPSLGKNSR